MWEADMLDQLGCEVVEAGSAEAALPTLEQGGFDVVVSDLGLPGMSGDDFCREVRRRWPQIAIIFATGMDRGPELDDPARTALHPAKDHEDHLRMSKAVSAWYRHYGVEWDDRIEQLEKLVATFKQAAFGPKSEKADPGQFDLALEDLKTAIAVLHAKDEARSPSA